MAGPEDTAPSIQVSEPDRVWAYWPMEGIVTGRRFHTLADCPPAVDTVILMFGDLDAQRGISLWEMTQLTPQQSMISMIRRLQRRGTRVTLAVREDADHPWEKLDPARVARTAERELVQDWGFDGIHIHKPRINGRTGPRLFDVLRRLRAALGPDRELSILLPRTRGEVQKFLDHAAPVLSMAATTGFGRNLGHRVHAFGRCSRTLTPERVAFGVRPGAVTDRTSTSTRLLRKLSAYRPPGARKAGVVIDHLGRDLRTRTGRSDFAVLHDVHLGCLRAQEAAEKDARRDRIGRPAGTHPGRKG